MVFKVNKEFIIKIIINKVKDLSNLEFIIKIIINKVKDLSN